MAFKNPEWESMRIIVLMGIMWTGLGEIVMACGMVTQGYPPIGWLNTVLLAVFAVMFSVFYMKEKS